MGGRWGFSWRRDFFEWETNLFNYLLEDLEGFSTYQEDRWIWKLEEQGVFSVKSMYAKLEGLIINDNRPEEENKVFRQIWKSGASSKVVAFSWKLLLDRISTRINLHKRNVLPMVSAITCVWCAMEIESSNHLFLHCSLASNIWLKFMWWFNFNFITPPNLFGHWKCLVRGSMNKEIRKGLSLIWHAAIWKIWQARNDRIFINTTKGVKEIVEEVKIIYWRWILGGQIRRLAYTTNGIRTRWNACCAKGGQF